MDAFTAAIAILHADPHLGVDVIYTAPPVAGIAVRGTLSRHDPVLDFATGFESQVRSPSWELHLRQADVPARPRAGTDQVTIGAVTSTISDVREDAQSTEWVVDLGG